ncbi:DUF4158 domain-containing protein [Streptomyces chartreusis]
MLRRGSHAGPEGRRPHCGATKKVTGGALEQYGQRAQTRSDHLRLVLRYLDWRPAPAAGESLKELEQFLGDQAMEHDTPSLLFHQAAEFLISARVTRTGVVTLGAGRVSVDGHGRVDVGGGGSSTDRADAQGPR